MKILCDVNQVECIRHGIDAPSSTVKIEVDPKSLTEEQRELLANEIYDGLRFPSDEDLKICPPTSQGFMAAIQYALKKATRPEEEFEPQIGYGALRVCTNEKELEEFDRELKEFRQRLIKAAIEESGTGEKLRGSPSEIAEELTRMARPLVKKHFQIPPESVPPPFRRPRPSGRE